MFFSIALFFNNAFCQSILENTTWRGVDNDRDQQITFLPNGAGKYTFHNGAQFITYDHIKWSLNGSDLTINKNNFVDMTAKISGNKIIGTAINKPGKTWSFEYTKIDLASAPNFEQVARKYNNQTGTSVPGTPTSNTSVITNPVPATSTVSSLPATIKRETTPKMTEISAGTNNSGTTYKVYYGDVSGDGNIRKLTTISNFTKSDGTVSSRKISTLLNCEKKEVFYLTDASYDQHWANGNAKLNEVKPYRFKIENLKEEQKAVCSTPAEVSDKNVSKEWDVKDKSPDSKSRTQILEEYQFKWKNGNQFNMSDVGKMMVKCAGYSISLYELQPRMSILQHRGGKEFLAKVDAVRADQTDIVIKLYGQSSANEMLSKAATLMGMMIQNPGGIDSNSREAKDCFDLTKTAKEMMNVHYAKLPPVPGQPNRWFVILNTFTDHEAAKSYYLSHKKEYDDYATNASTKVNICTNNFNEPSIALGGFEKNYAMQLQQKLSPGKKSSEYCQ